MKFLLDTCGIVVVLDKEPLNEFVVKIQFLF